MGNVERAWIAALVLIAGLLALTGEAHAYIGESLGDVKVWCGKQGGSFSFESDREGGYKDYRCTMDRGNQSLTVTVADTTIVGFVIDRTGLARGQVVEHMKIDLRKMGKPIEDLRQAKKKGQVGRTVTWRHGDIETVGVYIYDPDEAFGRVVVIGSIKVIK